MRERTDEPSSDGVFRYGSAALNVLRELKELPSRRQQGAVDKLLSLDGLYESEYSATMCGPSARSSVNQSEKVSLEFQAKVNDC